MYFFTSSKEKPSLIASKPQSSRSSHPLLESKTISDEVVQDLENRIQFLENSLTRQESALEKLNAEGISKPPSKLLRKKTNKIQQSGDSTRNNERPSEMTSNANISLKNVTNSLRTIVK